MSINFYPYIRKPNSEVWHLPDEVSQDPDNFELSFSSSNGMDVLAALGIPATYSEEPWPIISFSNLVTAVLREHLDHRSPAIATAVDNEPGKMPLIYLGRREGYIEQRLGDLALLIQRGKAIGATHIGWG